MIELYTGYSSDRETGAVVIMITIITVIIIWGNLTTIFRIFR